MENRRNIGALVNVGIALLLNYGSECHHLIHSVAERLCSLLHFVGNFGIVVFNKFVNDRPSIGLKIKFVSIRENISLQEENSVVRIVKLNSRSRLLAGLEKRLSRTNFALLQLLCYLNYRVTLRKCNRHSIIRQGGFAFC